MVLRFARRAAWRATGTGQRSAEPAALAQVGRGGRGAARGRAGHRPGARAGSWLAAARPHRTAGRGRHRRGDPGRGPLPRRLRDRGLWPERRQPAPRAVSDRVLRAGDAVVVDIGGTMPSGYCSDCTRTYVIGAPGPEFASYYEVLKGAQDAACAAVRPGVSARVGGRGGPGADHRGRLRRASSCTGPATGSGSRRTRTPTSWPATPSRSSRARVLGRARHLPWPATGPGSRTSSSAPTDWLRAAQQRDSRARHACRPDAPRRARQPRRRGQGAVRADRRDRQERAARRRSPPPSATARFPREVFRLLGRAGLLGLPYPEEFGGGGPAVRDVPAGGRGARRRPG